MSAPTTLRKIGTFADDPVTSERTCAFTAEEVMFARKGLEGVGLNFGPIDEALIKNGIVFFFAEVPGSVPASSRPEARWIAGLLVSPLFVMGGPTS